MSQQTFTYTDKGANKTLPFNPENYGFTYNACPCQVVKFRHSTDDAYTELWFRKDEASMTVSRYKLNTAIGAYDFDSRSPAEPHPQSNEELEAILSKHNLLPNG